MADKQIAGLTGGTPILTDVMPKQIADASTEATKVTYQQVKNLIQPYNIYRAILTQTSTNDPVVTELQNDLGGTITISRASAGQYTIDSADNLFTTDKTFVMPQWATLRQSTNYATGYVHLSNVGQVLITTYLNGVAADDLLTDFPVEILVYI